MSPCIYATRIFGQKCLPVLVLLIILTACGGGASKSQLNIGSGELLIEFPYSLERHLTDEMEVKAVLTLDGNNTYALNVDRTTKNVTGSIDGISKGNHTLVVEYFTIQDGLEYSIVKGSIDIDIGDIEIISLTYSDLIYSDDDNDGTTNIAELELGTNPFNSKSLPSSHGAHGSTNYGFKDIPLTDSIIIGTSVSVNYQTE